MLFALPLFPALAGLALWTAGDGPRLRLGVMAGAAAAGTLLLAALAAARGWSGGFAWGAGLDLHLALTPLSAAVAITVPAVALPVLVFAAAHEDRRGLARLLGLMLIFTGAMLLTVAAADLLTLLIGWEVMGFCSWALIGHHWRDRANMASGRYAFVMTRLGDLGLFLALMATWNRAGSLEYAALGRLEGITLALAAFGVLAAAAAKAGQGPFALWLFRAMDGPSAVSALLHAATMVAAGAYLLARLHPWLASVPGWSLAVIALGLFTALAGGAVAVMQGHAKKLLAGSTSAQLGLMFIAVGAGYPGVAVAHLVTHAAFKAPLFLSAGVAGEAGGTYRLREMGYMRALPWTAGLTALAALALAAVPFMGAAWSKEQIVAAATHESVWLGLFVMLAGALSAAYAMRFWFLAYGPRDAKPQAEPRRPEIAATGALALTCVALGVLWAPPLQDALPLRLPEGKPLEIAGSLAFVALGLVAGLTLARRETAPPPTAADWLGLPALIERGVVRPFERFARLAARTDDDLLDAIPRGAATGARRVARGGRWVWGAMQTDDALLDAIPRSAAAAAHRVARGRNNAGGAMQADRVVLDAAVWQIAAATRALARLGDRRGELLADGLPEGAAGLTGRGGADARRLQTGLSHQYYAIFAIGAGLAILFLITEAF
ncbi:NADH-quinone oxidoreductase subunit L [Roseovarius spongiae]|uniref:NADH-quinone oxidoreductase subunit L n=1 Tax=Roseovarius spongiae TaxID=2320272 RepID=A0A3A8B3W8_9RHOB|nr:proton-conducting transporter membrane subunit [Roseovarius spongiae]RKF12604.1 NADH-quinone oxidoreductase subunit L [Roseovarius spongiae]